ncbi:chemotaxis protein CheC [Clostridium tagluense]|uniref:CheY-P-specific phosphatase CheC n=1 Tax=Clostridium tagluense TaxID=360422 RepID=A0A401UHQ3_9CLOT|nr:chemotaxis protein CheC [Clostridium tagluense]GCD09036.1 CheY-P-specific phosphatase CheC [Clostridium tagluense]
MDYSELSAMQLDVLQEVGNIGAGNAATSLSELLNEKVDMAVPSVNIVPFDDIFSGTGVEEVVIGVIVRVLGDIPGNILFTFDKETALRIISSLVGAQQEEITEIGSSALCEIGNIIASSFMNAIAKLTSLTIMPSVPAVAVDMMGAILSTTFIESGQYDEHVLDLETQFLQENHKVSGHFYYIPMPGSLEKILNSLGVN